MIESPEYTRFETALLAELREESARRAHTRRRFGWKARAAAVGAVSVTTAIGAFGLRPDGAFAVVAEPDGDVTVTVSRWDDAAGLEAALADKGVEAEISYSDATDKNTFGPPAAGEGPPPWDVNDPESMEALGISVTTRPDGWKVVRVHCSPTGIDIDPVGDGISFTISADRVRSDKTLHLTTAGSLDAWSGVQMWWEGDACVAIDD